MNTCKIELPGVGEKVVSFKKESYLSNETLAVSMCVDNDVYGIITMNIEGYSEFNGENEAFLDTNNYPYIGKFLYENGIAVKTDACAMFGKCVYPLYKFDLKKLS